MMMIVVCSYTMRAAYWCFGVSFLLPPWLRISLFSAVIIPTAALAAAFWKVNIASTAVVISTAAPPVAIRGHLP